MKTLILCLLVLPLLLASNKPSEQGDVEHDLVVCVAYGGLESGG